MTETLNESQDLKELRQQLKSLQKQQVQAAKALRGLSFKRYQALRYNKPEKLVDIEAKMKPLEEALDAYWNVMRDAIDAADLIQMRRLLSAGYDPSVRARYGEFPLMRTALNNHLAAAELLLQAGAPVDQVDFERQTALISAAYKGNLEIVRLLLAHGANHNHANEFGKTAVQEAQAQGHDQIVMMLLNQV